MSEMWLPPGPPTAVVAPPPTGARPGTLLDLRVAALLAVCLAALGAALGPAWAAWSGPQQRAYVVAPGALYPYQEVETRVAADARYFVIIASVGILAGLLAWLLLPRHRGPLVLLGLVIGALGGAALTAWVGYLTGGGTYSGKPGTFIAHLPVALHMRGLIFVEPALAALTYGVFAAFAVRDDLGRPDPARPDPARPDPARPDPAPPQPAANWPMPTFGKDYEV